MFQPCLSWETENPCKFFIYKGLSSSSCTQTRGRTGMEVNPLVFETSASTDSAIWALVSNAVQRYGFFLKPAILSTKKGEKSNKISTNHSSFVKYAVL